MMRNALVALALALLSCSSRPEPKAPSTPFWGYPFDEGPSGSQPRTSRTFWSREKQNRPECSQVLEENVSAWSARVGVVAKLASAELKVFESPDGESLVVIDIRPAKVEVQAIRLFEAEPAQQIELLSLIELDIVIDGALSCQPRDRE